MSTSTAREAFAAESAALLAQLATLPPGDFARAKATGRTPLTDDQRDDARRTGGRRLALGP